MANFSKQPRVAWGQDFNSFGSSTLMRNIEACQNGQNPFTVSQSGDKPIEIARPYNSGMKSSGDYTNRRNDCGSGKYDDEWSRVKDVDYAHVRDKLVIKKDFYRETQRTRNRPNDQVLQWRCDQEISIDDPECYCKPILDFCELDVPAALQDVFRKNNYQTPTPIQAQSWPICLQGRDCIAIARTGSGKTLGFLVPAMVHIRAQPALRKGDGPIAVVLTPTRELAQQVHEEARKFGQSMRIRTTPVYGGAAKLPQKRELEAGSEIIVACPGRLLDFIQSGTTNMSRCSFLIMDEADRMLDMGFEPQIRKIVGQMRKEKQTLMYSATWPKEVRRMAEDFQNNPAMITIGSRAEELFANPNIQQIIEVCEEWDKPIKFTNFMEKAYGNKVFKSIVFTDTKKACDYLAQQLSKRGWPVAPIHGDKDQRQRDSVLRDFKQGRIPILIATDVAARGIDVPDIKYVINYDFPGTMEDYIHRIGRTARGEKTGVAYSLITRDHARCCKELISILERSKQQVPKSLIELQTQSKNMAGAKARSRRNPALGGGYANTIRSRTTTTNSRYTPY